MKQPEDYGVWFEHHAFPIVEQYHSSGRGALSADDYLSCLLYMLEGEVGNGGTDQYFFNMGHLAPDTVAGLELIGAVRAAKLLSEICRCFPDGVLKQDLSVVRAQYESLPSVFFELCSQLDTALMGTPESGYVLEENLAILLHSYLKNRRNKK